METDQARIALAEAMNLHEQRLQQAHARCRAARAEMDSAHLHLNQVIEARRAFMAYVAPRTEQGQREAPALLHA